MNETRYWAIIFIVLLGGFVALYLWRWYWRKIDKEKKHAADALRKENEKRLARAREIGGPDAYDEVGFPMPYFPIGIIDTKEHQIISGANEMDENKEEKYRMFIGAFLTLFENEGRDVFVSVASGTINEHEAIGRLWGEYDQAQTEICPMIPYFLEVKQEALDDYFEWRLAQMPQEAESSA